MGKPRRAQSKLVHDRESISYDEEQFSNYEEYRYRERSVSDHILDRFTRLFRFIGTIQRISEQTDIPREQVVKGGASEYQDQSSHRGTEIHAAHVVRAGEINPQIRNDERHILIYNELINFLGHTQNVARYANEWHGIGGDIDKIQSGNLKKLASIDFRRSLTAEVASTIQSVTEEFIAALDKRINKGDLGNKGVLEELIKARKAITDFKIEAAFEKGKDGYSGKYMKDYQ